MILSDRDLKRRIVQIRTLEEFEEAKGWWENADWATIQDRILIYPFNRGNLGSCSYDLSIGAEYIRLRRPDETEQLSEEEVFSVGPGETVLILTQECVSLPNNVMAMIVPRARWIFEGTSICASRIEPTWYGNLIVGFTNLTKSRVLLQSGEAFCTCYFVEASEIEEALTKEKVPHLGRKKIGKLMLAHVRPEIPLSAEKVTRTDLEDLFDKYGTPWDIVQGAFTLTQKELQIYVDREVAPDIVEEATSAAVKRAFDDLIRLNSRLTWGVFGLMTAFLGAVGTIAYLIYLLVSGP